MRVAGEASGKVEILVHLPQQSRRTLVDEVCGLSAARVGTVNRRWRDDCVARHN
jgi:hypothetical protein